MIFDKNIIIPVVSAVCWILFGIWLTRDDPTHLFMIGFFISGALGGLLGYWLIRLLSAGIIIDQRCEKKSSGPFHLNYTLGHRDVMEFRLLINRFRRTRNLAYALAGSISFYLIVQQISDRNYLLALLIILLSAAYFLLYKKLFFSKIISLEKMAEYVDGKHELHIDCKSITDNDVISDWRNVFYHISQGEYIYIFSKLPWVFVIPKNVIEGEYSAKFNDSIACFRKYSL